MGWSIGEHNGRDIGYGVPAVCDHPKCGVEIDRGLAHVCGGFPFDDVGCGLYFCGAHLRISSKFGTNGERYLATYCTRCRNRKPPFTPKPDTAEWIHHKATDPSWEAWRQEQERKVPTDV